MFCRCCSNDAEIIGRQKFAASSVYFAGGRSIVCRSNFRSVTANRIMSLFSRTVAAVSIVLLLAGGSLVAQEASPENGSTPPVQSIFEDPNLEAAVRDEVFEKRYNDDPITAEDVKNISRVIGRGKAIASLEGLQHCRRLMLVDLADNEITDLTPIADLKLLQSITLADNQLTDITPLAKLTKAQLVDLSGNRVTDLSPLKDMSNLRTLYIAGNGLTSLDPIAGLTKIWSLDASDNQLTDLSPVKDLSSLTTLNLSGNRLTSLEPIANLQRLNLLLAERNQISDLSTLVQMCREDYQSDRRFAPYLDVYLDGNPIESETFEIIRKTLAEFGTEIKSRSDR